MKTVLPVVSASQFSGVSSTAWVDVSAPVRARSARADFMVIVVVAVVEIVL